MPFSNTIISLDDVDITTLSAGKFLRVRPEGNLEISQYDIPLNDLHDVEASGAYAPTTGQTLVYTAANTWRPATLDVYSVSNGLNKSGLTISVTAGSGGGLVANTSGVFIEDIANVSGSYGNATHTPVFTVNSKGQITDVTPTLITTTAASSLTADYINSITGTAGQITVTGGTGNKANSVLNLVATGVTAGVYGNTTHAPRITVDTYGRISSVDSVAISGGGGGGSANAGLSFANIHIAGQTSIGAERAEDDLTIVQGTGMALTTTANADTISIGINPVTAAQAMDIADFKDVDATGITNGQVLIWNSSTSKFEAGDQTGSGGGSNVALTSFSVVTASPSGNGGLAYDNAGVFTYTPANVSGGGAADQTLSASGNVITISGSNDTVDLTTMLAPYSKTDTDAQDLTLSGNIISLSGQSGNVDLTTLLASGGSTQSLSWNAGTSTISISGGNAIDLSVLKTSHDTLPELTDVTITSPTSGQVLKYNGTAWINSADADTNTDTQDLSLSGNVITLTSGGTVDLTSAIATGGGNYGDSNVATYLNAQGFATQSTETYSAPLPSQQHL